VAPRVIRPYRYKGFLFFGGRAIKRIIDNSISEAKWEIMTQNKFKEFVLNKDCVSDPKKYILR